jgi:Tannase and feruloyl esterase
MRTSTHTTHAGLVLALILLASGASAQADIGSATRLPSCIDLGTNPTFGLAGNPGVTHLKAAVVPIADAAAEPSGPSTNFAEMMERGAPAALAYCRVDFTYSSGRSGTKDGYDEGQNQAIGIRIGLPLRVDDGGTSTAWNGKIQNLGSGGCMGYVGAVTQATNHGYVGTASDGGHGAPWILFNCDFGVIQDKHVLNEGLIRDFSSDHVIWQTRLTKALVKAYYGEKEKRTYWTGCSQGGREAVIAAQTVPEEYDGILGGGAALGWMRFQMAQAWSGLVIKDLLKTKGKILTAEQIAATVQAEVKACDAQDGVADGVIGDPRSCHWSARRAICGTKGSPRANCLDADQANAFDVIRRGPINSAEQLIWYPWEPGTTFPTETNYLLSDSVMRWAVKDLNFKSADHLYLDKAHLAAAHDPRGITYEDMATLASQVGSDLADVDSPALDKAKARGLKMILWTGTADRNIQSRITINYMRQVAAHFGTTVTDDKLQSWMRVFMYPGVDHCAGGVGPQPGNVNDGPLFDALVNWVEKGIAPDQIIATEYPPLAPGTQPARIGLETRPVLGHRPVCPYPKTALYAGSGDTHDPKSFLCGGNLETATIVKQDELAQHKAENTTGKVPAPYGGSQGP